jgi:hypothetical protein
MDPLYAESKVAGPAIGLMITAAIGMLLQLVSGLMNLLSMLGGTAVALDQGADGIGMLLNGVVGLGINAIGLVMGFILIFGAVKMKGLSSYGLAMGASVIAMLPCLSPCCFLGLPMGIWSLVTLSDPEVKAAFEARSSGADF